MEGKAGQGWEKQQRVGTKDSPQSPTGFESWLCHLQSFETEQVSLQLFL